MTYIAIIATLDTKGEEAEFLARCIRARGHEEVTIDCGLLGPPSVEPQISRDEIARAAGKSIGGILAQRDKSLAIRCMAQGAAKVVTELYAARQLHGIVGLGGMQGTIISSAAMLALPLGIPKMIVSSVANGGTTFGSFVGTRDITIMHSVADISGLNTLTRSVLARAAGAICGMVESAHELRWGSQPVIGLTMAGVTTPCAVRARQLLEGFGYEVISFHCNGVSAMAMEELAQQGRLQGILELGPHDITDFLFGGLMPCDSNRLVATCQRGVPIVFVPGATDFILLGPVESISAEMRDRKLVRHNPLHTHVRTTKNEMVEVGKFVAQRLAGCVGPALVLVPARGLSQQNYQGGPLFDPEADGGFLEGIMGYAGLLDSHNVEVKVLDQHVNDDAFAEQAVSGLLRLVRGLPGVGQLPVALYPP